MSDPQISSVSDIFRGAMPKPAPKPIVPAAKKRYMVRLGHDKGIVEGTNEAEAKTAFMVKFGITKSKHQFEISEVQ